MGSKKNPGPFFLSCVCVCVCKQSAILRSEGGTTSQKPSINWRVGGHLQGLSSETNSRKAMKSSDKSNLLKLKWKKDDYFHIKLGEIIFFHEGMFLHNASHSNTLPIRSKRVFYNRRNF